MKYSLSTQQGLLQDQTTEKKLLSTAFSNQTWINQVLDSRNHLDLVELGNKSPKPYFLLILNSGSASNPHFNADNEAFVKSLISSLRFSICPRMLEVDCGDFVLNLGGVLGPEFPIEIPDLEMAAEKDGKQQVNIWRYGQGSSQGCVENFGNDICILSMSDGDQKLYLTLPSATYRSLGDLLQL